MCTQRRSIVRFAHRAWCPTHLASYFSVGKGPGQNQELPSGVCRSVMKKLARLAPINGAAALDVGSLSRLPGLVCSERVAWITSTVALSS